MSWDLLRKFVNGKEAAKVADVIAKLTATQAFAAFILRDIGRWLVIFIRDRRTVITALIAAIGPGAGVGQHDTSRKNSAICFRRRGQYKGGTHRAQFAALLNAPAESCGFVVRAPEGERYFPGVNISGEPEDYFRMAPEDWLQAEMQGEIVALVHSHPGGLPWLSEADRRLQVQSDLPWWLVCRGAIHKFRCVPHLTGRRFEHGVTDCYTLFRDAYHLAGIEMPDFHRGDDWWRHGQNLYLDNLEATGLYQVPLSAAQPGDVLLCCFGSSVPNHAAIYCGDGELLHHIPEQLSKRERYTDKWQRRTHSLWRHREWHASAFTGICNDLAAASTFV